MNEPNEHSSDHLAKRVFSRIEGEHLSPRPRWEFILKNYVFWALGALTVILGAFAASAALFEIGDVDWTQSVDAHTTSFGWFLAVTPFLWILALALFLLVGYLNIRRTKHGYRYPLAILALGTVLTSLTLGFALYTSGFGEGFENVVRPHLPHQLFFDQTGSYHHHHFHYDY